MLRPAVKGGGPFGEAVEDKGFGLEVPFNAASCLIPRLKLPDKRQKSVSLCPQFF